MDDSRWEMPRRGAGVPCRVPELEKARGPVESGVFEKLPSGMLSAVTRSSVLMDQQSGASRKRTRTFVKMYVRLLHCFTRGWKEPGPVFPLGAVVP